MSNYYCEFIARKVGAIGERGYYNREVREVENEEEAIGRLYKEFEHICVKHVRRYD